MGLRCRFIPCSAQATRELERRFGARKIASDSGAAHLHIQVFTLTSGKSFPEGASLILGKEKFESETRKEKVSMDKAHQVVPDIEVLPAYFAIPGMGFLGHARECNISNANLRLGLDTALYFQRGFSTKEFSLD